MPSILQLFAFAAQMMWQELRCGSQYEFDIELFNVTLPGDSTAGFADNVRVRWVQGTKGSQRRQLPPHAPIVLLTPGLNCYAGNLPGTAVYTKLLEQPWRIGVYEKRGVGSADDKLSKLKAPVFHMFGHPSDLHSVIKQLVVRWPDAPIHLVGMSSGNGLTSSYLALHGGEVPNLQSCLCLIGGEDYNTAFSPPQGNWLSRAVFDGALLAASKQRMLCRNSSILQGYSAKGYEAAMSAQTQQAFYDVCMSEFSGYSDREEAERRINPWNGGTNECMLSFRVPYLVCFCEDDPVAPGGPRKSWVDIISKCEFAALAMFQTGSHLACYDSWHLSRWVDRLTVEWIKAIHAEQPKACGSGIEGAAETACK
jgi:predicted alpha/beta-fold hydrolase